MKLNPVNKEERKQWMKKYHVDNGDKNRKQQRANYRKIRLECLMAYSIKKPKCVCCGEEMMEFLCIDHKNGDGNFHRKKLKTTNIFWWLKKNGFPEGFQILCHNCNMGKTFHKGICPHQKSKILL